MRTMRRTHLYLIALAALFLTQLTSTTWAREGILIDIPAKSYLTPVQRLNREGVAAIKNKHYEKAAKKFYQAYLYDPGDPFTLNNLGYIYELQGEYEQAREYYTLAQKQHSSAIISKSNVKALQGTQLQHMLDSTDDHAMQLNRINTDALFLLSERRANEAVSTLVDALHVEAANAFTLNNLAVAYEHLGDYDSALVNYAAAANLHSQEIVILASSRAWIGRPVSDMAGESARLLRERIKHMSSSEALAAKLTAHGVAAANRGDWHTAVDNFLQAYSLDSSSAFSRNNRGFVAERYGDLESAQFFYNNARQASDSRSRIGTATVLSAEGKKLTSVSMENMTHAQEELAAYKLRRQQRTDPIELELRKPPAAAPLLAPADLKDPATSQLLNSPHLN